MCINVYINDYTDGEGTAEAESAAVLSLRLVDERAVNEATSAPVVDVKLPCHLQIQS